MMGIVVTEHCVIVNIFGETVGPLIYDRNSCNRTLCYSEYLGETVGPLIYDRNSCNRTPCYSEYL